MTTNTRPVVGIVRIDPAVGGWITTLREHADVVWATTWEDMANTVLAPLLGIDPLPVAVSTRTHPVKFGQARRGESVPWKESVLREAFVGRPLVWADDGPHWLVPDGPEQFPDGRTWYDWRVPVRPPLPSYLAGLDLDFEDEDDDGLTAAPSMVIVPDERVGLTVEHRVMIDAFVADPYGYTGHLPDFTSWHDA